MSYRQQWQDYKTRNLVFWIFFFGFVAGLFALFLFSASIQYPRVVAGIAILWTAGLVVSGYRKTRWKCPRCHKPFQQWQPGNPTAIGNKCMHCSLPKFAEEDE